MCVCMCVMYVHTHQATRLLIPVNWGLLSYYDCTYCNM